MTAVTNFWAYLSLSQQSVQRAWTVREQGSLFLNPCMVPKDWQSALPSGPERG